MIPAAVVKALETIPWGNLQVNPSSYLRMYAHLLEVAHLFKQPGATAQTQMAVSSGSTDWCLWVKVLLQRKAGVQSSWPWWQETFGRTSCIHGCSIQAYTVHVNSRMCDLQLHSQWSTMHMYSTATINSWTELYCVGYQGSKTQLCALRKKLPKQFSTGRDT